MSSLQVIRITAPETKAGFQSICDLAPGQLPAMNNLIDYLGGLTGGNYSATLVCDVGAIQASGTLTVATGGSANNQACTICNITLTGKTSSTADNEFSVSAVAATQAAAMAAAINASTTLAGKVTATSALGVVTIKAVVAGILGNGFQLSAGNLANTTASAFASGSDGTVTTLTM